MRLPCHALALYDDDRNGRITCQEARRHGIAPVPRSHPANPSLKDADGDGVVCEEVRRAKRFRVPLGAAALRHVPSWTVWHPAMRLLIDKGRAWNRIHARSSDRRRLESKRKRKAKRRQLSSKGGGGPAVRSPGPSSSDDWSPRDLPTIECPEDFSLESNFDSVVNVIHRIRSQSGRGRRQGVYIDFRQIKQLSPTAALVLAAELDRWNHLGSRSRVRSVDVEEWDSTIRVLLQDMGFFDLLHVPSDSVPVDGSDPDLRYVKFRTGSRAEGEAITRLRERDLEPIVGAMPQRERLFAAVTEAMTNVVQHAYKRTTKRPNWWLSASRNPATSEVSIIIYDQGAGIPTTLPRRYSEHLRRFRLRDHAQMIRAAHNLKRTATKEPHRGHGLELDIRGYLNVLECEASYRVVSLNGEYICMRTRDGVDSHELKSHAEPLPGTLIEWHLTLQ